MTRILGAVLAGGASSRFGSDKAAALWRERSLLDHAAAALAPFVDDVVTVGRGAVADLPVAGLGPLGGIAGALDHASRHGFGSVLTIACDMPVVPADLAAALVRHAPSYCAEAPVLGHWPAALVTDLIARLAAPARSGARSVHAWATDVGALPIAAPALLCNVNTPADLPAP